MSIQLTKNVNFGKRKAFLTGQIGYTLIDQFGDVVLTRTTSGIYELASGSGIYAAIVTFPDDFRGTLLWDSGEISPVYASEQFNIEENNPIVDENNVILNQIVGTLTSTTTSLQFLVDMEGGRWRITPGNQMVFYKADNITEVARFNLFDVNGDSTNDVVADRRRV
jgi:hypothetical protein